MKANLIIVVKKVSLLKKIVPRTWWLPLTWGSLSNCACVRAYSIPAPSYLFNPEPSSCSIYVLVRSIFYAICPDRPPLQEGAIGACGVRGEFVCLLVSAT